jgi:hypothetical protein
MTGEKGGCPRAERRRIKMKIKIRKTSKSERKSKITTAALRITV